MQNLVSMAAVTHPFRSERRDLQLPEGLTVEEMLRIAEPNESYLEFAVVFIKGEVIPKAIWARYRPKPGVLVEVRAFPIPMGGGGGDGGKNPLRTVMTIAVLAFAMWAGPIAAGWLFGMGPLTSGAAMALKIASAFSRAAISYGGMLAVNAIAPVRAPKFDQLSGVAGQTDSPSLFIQGARNALSPFAPVPVVLGKYRMTPPLACKPFTEVIGDKQFVRMLFVWGIGPLAIDTTSLKIGETLLTEFDGVQIEHQEGYSTDDPMTLFPSTVNQEDFSIAITNAVSWVARTSEPNADELSIDISFPQGLVEFDDRGNRSNQSVTIEIEYREVGDSGWSKIDTTNAMFQTTAPTAWLNKSGNNLTSITFTQNRTSEIRHGIRWGVPTRGQYEIQIRRTTADTSSTQISNASYWTTLRTITDEDPVNSPVPVAKTALVIQATDQLNSVVDEFNGIVTTVAKDWNVGSPPAWVEQETQNPASLFRHILQGNGMATPLADARIDLDTLEEWHEFCEDKGFKFNMIRDFATSVWETLADVAAAGRAAPTQIDGKWSVVMEKQIDNPASFITPRNSYDFKAEKFFVNAPHGWRIRFPNEDEGYRFDERRVYRDGYSDANATLFETLELPGVTDPDMIFKLGRFRIFQGINQPERWTWKQDMEYLTYRRGSRVAITHDVLLVGLASGRIKSVVLSGADVTGVVLDEEVTMEAGNDYGIAIRTLSDAKITRQVTTVAGTTSTLTLTTPILGTGSPAAALVAAGDIFGFGILGEEADDASIISIVPENNMRAQITAVPYRETIFTADTETVPAFETHLTALTSIPAPTVRTVVSDESAMVYGAGETLRVRIGVGFDPLGSEIFGVEPELRVQMRRSGTSESYFYAQIDAQENNHVFIGGVRTGETWDIRLRFVVPGRLPGPWTTIASHLVVGKSTAPAPLSNMTISVFGAQALIRWDKPAELDVLFGGEVVFRHTQEFTTPTWSASVTIGQAARARTLYAVLPLKPGSYMARVYDVAGNPSDEITVVSTKQASVHQFASVDTLDDDPSWIGTHDDTKVDSSNLTMDDTISPRQLEGTYNYSQGIDLTTVQRVRLTTRLTVSIFNVSDYFDDRTDDIDDWEDFDASLQVGADARIFVRHTDDDPAGSPVSWSDWERLDSAEFEARAFEFYIHLTRDSLDYNILVSEAGIDVESVA